MASKNTNLLSIWILTRAGEKTRNTIPYWVAHPFMHYTPPPWLLGFMTDGTPYTDLRGLDNFVVSWSQHRNVKFCDFHGQVFHTSTKCTAYRQPFGNFVLSSLVSLRECHIWPWWPTLKLPCPNKCCWTWHTKLHTFFSGNTHFLARPASSYILYKYTTNLLCFLVQVADCGSLTLASKSLAYSKLPRPWLSTRIRSQFSLSSWDNAFTL